MEITPLIDYSLLKADVSWSDISKAVEETAEEGYAALCIPPYYVQKVKKAMPSDRENHPAVCTVIGFPLGYSKTSAKVEEVKKAIDEGADELDAVINICAVKDKEWAYIENDIDAMTRASHMRSKKIKIILETALLNSREIQKICEIINRQECDFAKTSTGFSTAGADATIIRLMRRLLNEQVQIKASGGIKTYAQALEMVEAGATRIGASNPKMLRP
jgi:deoxyribose-phosphate aldolase